MTIWKSSEEHLRLRFSIKILTNFIFVPDIHGISAGVRSDLLSMPYELK